MILGFSLAQKSTSSKEAAEKNGLSDASYIAKALAAAPPGVAKAAGVARIDKSGTVQTVARK